MGSLTCIAVCAIGALHFVLMGLELYQWRNPVLMLEVLNKKLPRLADDKQTQDIKDLKSLLAMVVHNVAIYNVIVGAALFATLSLGPAAFLMQIVLLAGGVVAGIFGAVTITKVTILQAVFGAMALAAVVYDGNARNGAASPAASPVALAVVVWQRLG